MTSEASAAQRAEMRLRADVEAAEASAALYREQVERLQAQNASAEHTEQALQDALREVDALKENLSRTAQAETAEALQAATERADRERVRLGYTLPM